MPQRRWKALVCMVSVALFLAATPEARHKQGSNVSQGTQDLKAQMDQAPIM